MEKLTPAVDEEDFRGVQPVHCDELPDEYLERASFLHDLKPEGQGIPDRGRGDVVSRPVRHPEADVGRIDDRVLRAGVAHAALHREVLAVAHSTVLKVVVAADLQPDVGSCHDHVMVLKKKTIHG